MLKVGDYVRTPLGIAKYLGKYNMSGNLDDWYEFDKLDENLWFGDIANVINKNQLNEVVIKSSPDIIDLIEVGDYVNGNKVYYLKGNIEKSEVAFEEDVLYTEYNDEYGEWYGYEEDEIETIVTKEQFEGNEYKVGEKK